MLFRQKELLRWLGVSVFEIWIWLISLTVFSVLLVLKVEGYLLPQGLSWFIVFSPLFICDGLNAYFCIIVFIRQYLDREFRNALLRAMWSLFVIGEKNSDNPYHLILIFLTSRASFCVQILAVQ